MITFTQNPTFGQLYAESVPGADWRIPTTNVEGFLSDLGLTLDELLASPQFDTEQLRAALDKHNG